MYRTASCFMIGITVMAVLACAEYVRFPGSKAAAEIFDWSRTFLPMMAALVIGYVFGRVSARPLRGEPDERKRG